MLEMLSEEEVMSILRIKARSTLWGYTKRHGFPRPVRTHPKQYLKTQVEQWIMSGGTSQPGS